MFKQLSQIVALFTLLITSASFASSFYISPVELFLSKDHPVTTLNIENQGNEAALLQINETFSAVSKNFVINPTIFSLPPKSTKTVQVGLKIKPEEFHEKNFSLFIKELKKRVNKSPGEVNFVIDFSVSLYVMPNHETKKLSWQVAKEHNKKIAIKLHNASNVHVKIVELYLTRPKQIEKLWELPSEQSEVLLSNASKEWQTDLTAQENLELHALIYWRNEPEMIIVPAKIYAS